MQLLMKGNKQRTQEPSAANKVSSRLHAVLQVTVAQQSRRKVIGEEVRIGKLFMVDLAGSERAAQVRLELGSFWWDQAGFPALPCRVCTPVRIPGETSTVCFSVALEQ